jgi:hypothetical protein
VCHSRPVSIQIDRIAIRSGTHTARTHGIEMMIIMSIITFNMNVTIVQITQRIIAIKNCSGWKVRARSISLSFGYQLPSLDVGGGRTMVFCTSLNDVP